MCLRSQIQPGLTVDIIQKHDQPTRKLTRGNVSQLPTPKPSHPHGIKVRLTTGEVGRVRAVISSTPVSA